MKILNYIPFLSNGVTIRYKFTPETINMDGDNQLLKINFGLNRDKFYYIGFRFDRKLQMVEVYHKVKYNKFVTTELLIKKSDILILDGFDIEIG